MRRGHGSGAARAVIALALAAGLLASCDGQGNSGAVKTPPPTATFTPVPEDSVILPAVESGSEPAGDQMSPLATPDAVSPLPSPTPTPAP